MKYFTSIRTSSTRGATLIEVLVAIGLTAVLLPALATGMSAAREGRAQDSERLQATALLREAEEAVRSVREKGWTNVATNGTYRPTISGSTWSLTTGAETVGSFSRQIVISDVQRNSSGVIVASGGTVDPSTKKAVTTVSWTTPIASSISNEIYLSRFNGNTSVSQTSVADFTDGTLVNTSVVNNEGGEVQLTGGSGGVDWASPSFIGSYNSLYDGNDVWSDGTYAYLVDNSQFYVINVTNKAAPTIVGTYDFGITINSVYVSGNYAYLATVDDSREFAIINITNKAAPSLTRVLNLGDGQNAETVYVSGTYAYVGKRSSTTSGQNEFYIINVATPASASLSGSFNIAGNVYGISVNGNYAYLATTEAAAEFRVMNITTKTAPTSAGVLNLSGSVGPNDLVAIGSTAYIAAAGSSTTAEFFIVNAATPASPTLVGSYENGTSASASFLGVAVSGTNAFLSGLVANQQMKVLNIATPSAPTVKGFTTSGDTGNDIFVSGDYVYMATQHDTRQLSIFSGAASGYPTTGTYECETFDAGLNVAFNYHTMTITEPAGTDIRFQVATNNNGSTWNYVGPDGTTATYFESAGGVPLNAVSARYWRYKVYFTSNGTATPILKDVQTNYSP